MGASDTGIFKWGLTHKLVCAIISVPARSRVRFRARVPSPSHVPHPYRS